MEQQTFNLTNTNTPRPEDDVTYNIGVDTDPVLQEAPLRNRAMQYHLSLGENSPGNDQIMTDLKSGRESKYQQMLQSQEMATRTETAKQLVTSNLDNPNVSPEDIASLAQLGTPPNVDTALEEAWSKKGADMLYAADDKSSVQKAMDANPMGLDATLQPFEKGIWKDRIAQKWKDKVDTMVSNTGWAPWAGYQAMQFAQVPTWANIIGNWKDGADSSSWVTSEALAQKVEYIRSLEPAEMDQAIKAEVAALAGTNPLDARKFVEALVSYSAADYDWNIVDDLSMLPVGTAAKAGKAAKGAIVGGKVVGTAGEAADAAKALRATTLAEEAKKAASEAPKAPGVMTDPDAAVKVWNNVGPSSPETYRTVTGLGTDQVKQILEASAGDASSAGKAIGSEIKSALDRGETVRINLGGNGKTIKEVDGSSIAILDDGQLYDLRNILGMKTDKDILQFIIEPSKDPLISEVQATARAVGGSHVDIPEALSGTGKPKAAVDFVLREGLAKKVAGDKAPIAVTQQIAKNASRTPSFFSPTVRVNATDEFYKSALVDDEAVLKRFQDHFQQLIDTQKLTRTPEELLPKLFEEKEKVMRAYYSRGVQDNIMSVENVVAGDTGALNVNIQKYAIGKTRDELFENQNEAIRYAKANGIKDARYKLSGGKWYIEAYAFVGEDRIAQSILVDSNKVPDTWVTVRNHLGSIMQTGDFQSIQRMRAVNGANKLGDVIQELYAPLAKLSKTEKNALNEIMKVNQLTEKVPGDPTTRGAYFRGLGELEAAYMRKFKRRPTPNEVVAYNTVVRNSDLMYQFMTWGEFRYKALRNVENIEVPRMVEGGGIARSTFEGKVLKPEELPIRERGPNVDAIVIDEKGIVKRYNLSKLSEEERTQLSKLVKEDGYVAVQPHSPDDPIVKKLGATQSPTAFVISKDYRRSPLRLDNQVSYRPGFSNEYKDGFYVKAPRVVDGRYEGDTAFFRVRSRAQANKLGALLQKSKELFDEGKLDEFRAFVDKNNFPFSAEKLGEIFTERFEKGIPLSVVRSGEKSNKVEKLLNGKTFEETFGQVSTELDDLYNDSAAFGNPFTNHRDPILYGVDEYKGTEDNPLWVLTEADMVDPMLTQTKAMSNLIKSEYYNDYQWTAATHWVETFLPNLENVTPEMARRNPLHWLAHGTLRGDPRRVAQAEQLRRGIKELVGEPSWLAGQVDGLLQRLTDDVYTASGQKYLEYVPDQALPFLTNPDTYLRTVSFRTKMSFFNPVQFYKQAASALNTVAAHPIHGMQAVPANFGMTLAYFTEDAKIIAKIDDIVSKASLGAWKPGEFTQSLKAFRDTGFDAVSGTGFKNNTGDPKVVYNGNWAKFLNAADFFFNQGELVNRYASWNTSWKKFGAENAKKGLKYSKYDIDTIHKYGQTLSGNMSRDANAWWQNDSRTTMFTQFQAYPMRMIENILGKEMDRGARIRLAMGQGILFGVPPIAGLHYMLENGGYDFFTEHLHTDAAKRGIDLDKSLIDMEYRGMASIFMEWVTGEKLDFASYGVNVPFGQTAANFDRVYRESGFLSAAVSSLLGASGSIGNNIIREGGYVSDDIINLVSGNGEYATVLPEDLYNLAREISSLNVWEKVAMAGFAAAYRNRSGAMMSTGEDPLADFTKAMLGVEEMDKTFAFNAMADAKKLEKLQTELKKRIERYAISMWEAEQNDDWEQSRKYAKFINTAGIAGGFSQEEIKNMVWLDGKKADLLERVMLQGIAKKMKAGSDERKNFEQEINKRLGD